MCPGRTPSAAREAGARLRYSSPLGASPSRSLDHARAPDAAPPSLLLPSYNGTYPPHYVTDTD